MLRRWGPSAIVLAVGVVIVVTAARGALVVGVVEAVVMAAVAWVLSPLFFPRPLRATDAHRLSVADGAPVVFWRPGCQYCLRLRLRLRTSARRLHWVDIWHDPEAAAELRGYTGGDETVPTVLVAGQAYVNPDPAWLRRLLQDR